MTRLIDAKGLEELKFVGIKSDKSLENTYRQGWNDAIDAIIDNAPTVTPKLNDEQIEKIINMLDLEWGYEGIREDVARILREADNV